MTPEIVLAVAVVVGLRLWLRRRHRATRRPRGGVGLGPLTSAVALVAAREVRERVRGKVFRIGTLLILAVVAAAIVIPSLKSKKNANAVAEPVGFLGALPAALRDAVTYAGTSIGTTVELVPEASVQAAQDDLRSGRITLAVIDGRDLVVNKAIDPTDTSTTAQLVQAVSIDLGVAQAFASAGVSAAQSSEFFNTKPLPVTSLHPRTAKAKSHSTSVVGLILVFVMLTQYNTWILLGVMEEKASRVVEVLLAAVRPIELLAGKVFGIGLVAAAQASLIVVFALGLGSAVGSDLLKGSSPLVLVSTLVWLVLGYAFYSWVYAAAGSMAERQDQIQSLAFPLSLPIIFGYVMSLTAVTGGNPSAFFRVLAYLPPTAPFAMPVLVGLGVATVWEFAASAALSIVCTFGVARVAANIYRRAILRTGGRVKLREILTLSAR